MAKVQISNQGIKKALKKIGIEEAVAEYIWNGFDAQATAGKTKTRHHGSVHKTVE